MVNDKIKKEYEMKEIVKLKPYSPCQGLDPDRVMAARPDRLRSCCQSRVYEEFDANRFCELCQVIQQINH